MKKEAWVEYLRIGAMLWIIAHHLSAIIVLQDGSRLVGTENSINYIVSILSFMGGDIGNIVFMLITGYFMCIKDIKISSLVKLWAEVEFYSVCGWLLSFVVGKEVFSLKNLIYMLCPFSTNQYWYLSTYMVLYPFFPMFNKVIRQLGGAKHKRVIGVMGILFVLMPSLYMNWLSPTNSWFVFIMMYFVGAYIRLYDKPMKHKQVTSFLGLAASVLSGLASVLVLDQLGMYSLHFVWGCSSFIVVLAGLFFFSFGKASEWKSNRIVSVLASTAFGVYIIHNGKLKVFLVDDILSIDKRMYTYSDYAFKMILYCCMIFILCALLDFIRQKTIEQWMLKHMEEHFEKIDNYVQKNWIS